MSDTTIDLAKEFNFRPFGRYRADSDRSAQAFREDLLLPALQAHDHVTVDLSGTNFYGSSFLEEVFGGLVREGFTKDQLDRKLTVLHNKLPSVVTEAKEYIKEAAKNSA